MWSTPKVLDVFHVIHYASNAKIPALLALPVILSKTEYFLQKVIDYVTQGTNVNAVHQITLRIFLLWYAQKKTVPYLTLDMLKMHQLIKCSRFVVMVCD